MLRLIKANQAPEKQPIFLFLVLLVCVSCCWWLCDLVMAQCEFSGVTQKDHESNATKKSTNKIFEFLEHPTPGSHNPCRRQWSSHQTTCTLMRVPPIPLGVVERDGRANMTRRVSRFLMLHRTPFHHASLDVNQWHRPKCVPILHRLETIKKLATKQ
jgi:hypothetical protein